MATKRKHFEAFGAVVREQRTAAGLSQERLALDAGVDRTFVSQIERGIRQPSLTTIWKLAEALGMAASTLVQRTEMAGGAAPRKKSRRDD